MRDDDAKNEGNPAALAPLAGIPRDRGARPVPGSSSRFMESRRRAAKVGMAVSLGALVYSGLRGREGRGLHVAAGVAFLGFSFWHLGLYPSGKSGRRGTP